MAMVFWLLKVFSRSSGLSPIRLFWKTPRNSSEAPASGGTFAPWPILHQAWTIEQPSSNIFVTPAAVVPLKIQVKDDLVIRDLRLVYTRSDHSDEGELVVPLFSGPDRVPPAPGVTFATSSDLGESRVIRHDWRLAAFNLVPGTRVLLHARASDYRPQVGQTPVARQITIITEAEF